MNTFLNPLSSTAKNGWKSSAIILVRSLSIEFCLAGVTDFCKNFLIELWVGLGGCGGALQDAADAAAAVAVDRLAPSLISHSAVLSSPCTDGWTAVWSLCRLFVEPALCDSLFLQTLHSAVGHSGQQ